MIETAAVDWGYAISTLIIRFVGIFVVLGILQVVIQITGRIFTRLDANDTAKSLASPGGLTQEQAAAIAMALYLSKRTP